MLLSLTGYHVHAFPFFKFEHSQKGRKKNGKRRGGEGEGEREKESKEEGREGTGKGRREKRMNQGKEGGRRDAFVFIAVQH